MLWVEGNLPTGHKTTVRTGLPQAAWRLLNYGVPKSKSTTAQVVEHAAQAVENVAKPQPKAEVPRIEEAKSSGI